MENVTDQTSNPFGMRADGRAVFGYGDANADFHVIGDHPGVHGGEISGVPFTEGVAGERLQGVLYTVGLATTPYSDTPELRETFLSYAHPQVPDDDPTDADYHDAERFLDAELRAVNAHILLPVGRRALDYTLRAHTTFEHRLEADATAHHAKELRGRGFLVVPVQEPADWTDDNREALIARLDSILGRDYRQTKGIPTLVG